MSTKWYIYRFLCVIPWPILFILLNNAYAIWFGLLLQASAFFAMKEESNRILKEIGSTLRV